MANLIFAGEKLSFVQLSEGLYVWQTYGTDNVNPFDLIPGDTYTIYWDEDEYQCVVFANEDMEGMGNLALGGLGENTGEPFAIGINLDGSNTFCLSTEPGEHSITIYHGIPGEGLVLKDRLGKDVTYYSASKVRIPTENGGLEVFTKGTPIENVPISLDFSGGDQVVTAPDGQFVKSAVIYKPEGLVPENIAEGIDIAGVLGTLVAGGGGEPKVAIGSFTGNGGYVTVTHGLGSVPKMVFVGTWELLYDPLKKWHILSAYGFSVEGVAQLNPDIIHQRIAFYYSSASSMSVNEFTSKSNTTLNTLKYAIDNITSIENLGNGGIWAANSESFCIGGTGTWNKTMADKDYFWIAIA